MKPFIISISTLALLICAVFTNSFYVQNTAEEIADSVSKIDTAPSKDTLVEIEKIYEHYKYHQRIISITVSHDDLTNIENAFAELIGATKAGDGAGLVTIKSRLERSLLHLGRLSGLNIDSII